MPPRLQMPLISVALAFALSACSDSTSMEFAKAVSPGGRWIARATDLRNFGPGTASDALIVTLQRAGSFEKPIEVLVVNPPDTETYPGHPRTHVQLSWSNPIRLNLVFVARHWNTRLID